MWIDVKIPYEPRRQLASAYNRAMETAGSDWVLLLDQDVFLCNPYWYAMCLNAVGQLEEKNAGLIVCTTNGMRQKLLQRGSSTDSDNIETHISISRSAYLQHGFALQEIHSTITGFFMLVNRDVWKKVPFKNVHRGVGKIDVYFSQRLLEAGFSIWLMTGLYIYHRRGLRKLKWEKDEKD